MTIDALLGSPARYNLCTAHASGSPQRPDRAAVAATAAKANEPAPVAAMGRAPDTSIRTTPGVSLPHWRWQKEYAIPDRMPGYSYTGGTIHPVPLTPIGTVRDACLAEWTIENGGATRYRWEGNDCSAATTPFAAR